MTVNQMPPVRKMGVERNITLFYTTTNIRNRPQENSNKPRNSQNHCTSIFNGRSTRHIPTLPITLTCGGNSTNTYAMLDSASRLTLMNPTVAQILKSDLQFNETINLSQALTSSNTATAKITVSVRPYRQPEPVYQLENIDVIETWNLSEFDANHANIICQKHPQLRHIKFAQLPTNTVGLIIGVDFAHLVSPRDVIETANNSPFGWRTPLGWSLCGRDNAATPDDANRINFVDNDLLFRHVADWMKIDANGISSDRTSMSQDDKDAIKILEATTKQLPNSHYEIGMLWKRNSQLTNNRWLATKQLHSLVNRLRRDPQMHAKYQETITTDIDKGYVVEVNPDDDSTDQGCWYLPHHPVTNINKPEKVRRVLNAASVFKGVSLNSSLLTGPDFLTNLTGIIMRFREDKIAISADIEAMFMQVFVPPADQRYLRFLWIDNNKQPKTYQYTRHIFGATDSPCVACYATRRCAKDNEDLYPDLVAITERNIYMDDLYKAVKTPEHATQLMKDLQHVFKSGGFNLTKWTSNSDEFLQTVDEFHLASPRTPNADARPLERVLGVKWKPDSDDFVVQATKFKTKMENVRTQRKLLKFVSSIFDPLGITAPLTIRLRQCLQLVWKLNPQWDKEIDTSSLPQLQQWIDETEGFKDVKIPRQYFADKARRSIELHIFSDASEIALATVAYLRIVYTDDSIDVKFIMGKAKVAPIKRMTIPNLELQAATNGAKLASFAQQQHDCRINNVVMWTDSTTVLHWIRSSNQRHRIFVANRLNTILDATNVSDWNYVPSKDNPADDATRGYAVAEMTANSRWLSGPVFLRHHPDTWPVQPDGVYGTKDVLATDTAADSNTSDNNDLINYRRYSTWTKALKVTTYVLLFVENLKKKTRQPLQVQHLANTFSFIVRRSQQNIFSKEFKALQQNKDLPARSRLQSLTPFIDSHGVLRARGRLNKAQMLLCSRHPAILDGEDYAVKLFMEHIHASNCHTGLEHTRSILQQDFWILHARKQLKNILRHCHACRRLRQDALTPLMADLPLARLPLPEGNYPFQSTGVDFFGPFATLNDGQYAKRYVLFFTCLVTRAVHSEICHQLDTDSTLQAIRRFIARRGKPTAIWSDNGRSFTAAEKELRELLVVLKQDNSFKDHLQLLGITWNFNPPSAPHFGGSWERLIRIFKDSFYKVIGPRTLSDETIATYTCEIEAFMNSRPLTTVSSDPADMEPLTPNHFLLGRSSPNLPPGLFTPRHITNKKTWKQAQLLAQHFWNRYLREYLPTLTKRTKWTKPIDNLETGDLVWILEDLTPRGLWPLGRVLRTFPGSDGVVRSCELKTSRGIIQRPVIKLSRVLAASTDA